MKNHLIMQVNAVLLIVTGIAGYLSSGSPTSLIADGVGIILLILSFPVKKENSTAAHIAVILTLLAAVMFWGVAFSRPEHKLVILMAALTTIALVLYIISFIDRKKVREANQKS
jgi:uncharacterized membrane protein (UPF0136 family)